MIIYNKLTTLGCHYKSHKTNMNLIKIIFKKLTKLISCFIYILYIFYVSLSSSSSVVGVGLTGGGSESNEGS